jgi:ABC-2 type transport system ATP-binding protein
MEGNGYKERDREVFMMADNEVNKHKSSEYVIEVNNLVKSFKKRNAVDDISLHVKKGTIFGFLGPNGAGKTTTISILCTLLTPTSGSAYINAHDCVNEAAQVRKSIGIVFQDTTLDNDLTAYENLTFHAYLYKIKKEIARERVDDALNFVDLYDRRKDLVRIFSGGMKRRLEVARGLLHHPVVLFLDEPTLGLDPQSRSSLWNLITTLPERHNTTVFMTTHYMEEAEVCDRISIIDHGKIIAQGTPDELKKLAGRDVIYLKSENHLRAKKMLSEKVTYDVSERNSELLITTENAEAELPTIIRLLGSEVISVRLQKSTLTDVFLKLTGRAIRDGLMSEDDVSRESVRAHTRRFRRK